ncbi:GntR family transcriptional regulator [Rhodococcus sp. HNM0569]|uniref:GntR family transcriptional regulator n=1 Tax=Rhodococcus sp. HNM0569 TaxID=2716340 RepID=UPI001469CDDA|nr:GntR family transcriptional regulator [Rhodococcus sp. HNM0569]NLU82467.1 FCD domain-containing protein [Rhodococcus sp. HNM0569]
MIVQESLVSLAVSSIEQMIVAGTLAPGQRITEPRLADELGISRPPLREALRVLASHGLVEQTPRRGYRVVELTEDDLDEIFSFRHVLEAYACELLVTDFDSARLAPLIAAREGMRAAAERADASAFAHANRSFHLALVQSTGHRRLTIAYERLLRQMQVSMAGDIHGEAEAVGDLDAAFARHDALLEALATGDRALVRRAHAHHGRRPYVPDAGDADELTA